MRIVVILLALATAAFAGSTVYYARQLSVERARFASTATDPAPVAGRTPAESVARAVTPDSAEAGTAAPATRGTKQAVLKPANGSEFISGVLINGQPMSEEDMKKMQAEYSRQFLAQLDNPEQREELLAERKMVMRHSYPRLAQVLGLSAEEYARYIELSALQQIEMQEMSSRCTLDPDCRMQDLRPQAGADRNQEIDDLLGPERKQKLGSYMNTMGEREAVAQLRNRLPESQRLGEDRAEALISALAEERNAIHQEASQQGMGSSSFGFGAGMVFTTGEGGSFEERYAIAQQNSQRLRERAAQHLNAEQLRAFNEMQDETLISLRGALRQKGITDQNGVTYSAVSITSGN
jgi:hypothetical protein